MIGRQCFYRRQFLQGNLALVCRSCHRSVEAKAWRMTFLDPNGDGRVIIL
jgi:hypothetical protein